MKENPKIANMTRKARKVWQYTYAPATYMSTAASLLRPASVTPTQELSQTASIHQGEIFTLQSLARQQGIKIAQCVEQAEVKRNPDLSKSCQVYPRNYKFFHGHNTCHYSPLLG